MVKGSRILGTGSYMPRNVICNKAIEALVDTSDQWIRERTGIVERRISQLQFGIIDRVIKEPIGGAQQDFEDIKYRISVNINEAIERFHKESIESLLTKRYYKFRKLGRFIES